MVTRLFCVDLVASARIDPNPLTHFRFKFPDKMRGNPILPQFSWPNKNLNRSSSSFNGNERFLVLEEMGNKEQPEQRKPRFLCLHGFRTSGEIMKKQVHKWPKSALERMDLVFLDGPFPAEGKSAVEGIFDPPYYEWFQFDKGFSEYRNFKECLDYIEESIIKHGPVDGLMGFSQGAILSAALPGLQAKGIALGKVPKIKCLIVIGGGKFNSTSLAEKAYSTPIECPSVHFLGEMDFMKPHGIRLLESFINPVTIHHPKGHTIPRLDEKSLELMLSFLDGIQLKLSGHASSREEQKTAF